MDSISLSQSGQNPDVFRPPHRRASIVGRPFLHIRQAKIQTFGETLRHQIFFKKRGLRMLSGTFTIAVCINNSHCNIISALHGERAPFVAQPNELIIREVIANRDLENGISFKRQEY